ncbi:hypothetical protein V6N12_002649 [Hibiscus sabdariffa]|uniref:C2H2-type domain-containing protein n=1 Tax=Hibiscus sabdariffa TaxID=183260 RepID=A0ABR2ED53_9ROSI
MEEIIPQVFLNLSFGQESQGVHLCRKCGWAFPNPHPSARHRRAHRKICGTIQGFKPAEEITHTNASDEDPISDEDHKNPSTKVPKVVEITSSVEESTDGIGAMSNRSEGVSSGAAMEFQGSGFGVRRQDSLDNVGKPDKDLDASSTISLKHFEDSDILQPPRKSADRNQNGYAFLESMPIVSTGTPEHQDDGKDFEDKNDSAIHVFPIEMETLKGFSEDSREVGAGPSAAKCSVEQPTNVNGNEHGKVNENLSDDLILPSEHAAGEISTTVSRLETRLDVTADIVQLKEDFSDRFASKTSMNGTGRQEETNGNGNPGVVLERNVTVIVSSNSEVPSVTTGKMEDITSATGLADKYAESSVEVRECVSQDKHDSAPTNQLDEDVEIDASYMQVAKDSYELNRDNEAIVKEVLFEEKAGVLQSHKWSDALSPLDADTTENEKDQRTCTLQEQQPVYVTDDLYPTGFLESMINDLPDVQSMVSDADIEAGKSNNGVGKDDMSVSKWAGGDNLTKNAICESVNNSSPSGTNPVPNLLEVETCDDIEKKKTEKHDINVVESGDGPEDLIKENSTFASISTDNQSPDVTEEANEVEGPYLDRISEKEDDIKEPEVSRDNKVEREGAGEDLMSSAVDNSREGNAFERTSIDQSKKELMHSTSCSEHTIQSSGAVDDNHSHESGPAASGTSTLTLQGEPGIGSVKPQLDTTIGDVSIGSSSHTDSLEAHWGSISVLSTQSEAFSEAERGKKSKVASEQHLDKSDEFDPPSFMTLVEPGPGGGDQKSTVSEIQAEQTAQSPTQGPNEPPGRKKNEEIIKKVTNWNAKQHTPLKNLLSEANTETKLKSPSSKQSPASVVTPSYDKMAEFAKLGPETPVAEPVPTDVEAGKEWSSPARFPAEIKRQKRKVKGRPLWVQFVCCSSMN